MLLNYILVGCPWQTKLTMEPSPKTKELRLKARFPRAERLLCENPCMISFVLWLRSAVHIPAACSYAFVIKIITLVTYNCRWLMIRRKKKTEHLQFNFQSTSFRSCLVNCKFGKNLALKQTLPVELPGQLESTRQFVSQHTLCRSVQHESALCHRCLTAGSCNPSGPTRGRKFL